MYLKYVRHKFVFIYKYRQIMIAPLRHCFFNYDTTWKSKWLWSAVMGVVVTYSIIPPAADE